ncbi:MAG: T9SS type A sorting domain-containing protein [Candidatus Sabulitectum sp.]|nr:T9SS type A sorting domain-containing protein [Candidatus Sabulitectum sp.]
MNSRILAVLLVLAVCPTLQAADIWVMGYYVGYHVGLQSPNEVDYSTMTHIMVGAAIPQNDGTFDTNFYMGSSGPAWAQETVNLAHTAGIKAVLMVGGAGSHAAFQATQNPTVRAAFVSNLSQIVNSYGFDGIDLDWEPIPASDRDDILALSQDLRTAMPDKVMTIPLGWSNSNFPLTDSFWGQLSQYFDRVNMMSYHMTWIGGGWESWHSSALYGETPTTPSSIDHTVSAYLASGIPGNKIGIGIGFFGEPYENGSWSGGIFVHNTSPPYITEPGQSTTEAAIRVSDNWFSYSNIIRYVYDSNAREWDDTAKVPYLSFDTPFESPWPTWPTPPITTTYVTYEDVESIAAKGLYVHNEELGGCIIWTISQGYLDWLSSGEKDPLMKAVKIAFLETTAIEQSSPAPIVSSFSAYPNPVSSLSTIQYNLLEQSHVTIEVFDISGRPMRTVQDGFEQKGEHSFLFQTAELPAGVYMLRLASDSQTITQRIVIAR